MAHDTIVVYLAGEDLSAKQYHCVRDNAGAAAAFSADTQVPVGILQNAPVAGGACSLADGGDGRNVSKAVLGGTVAKGDHLGPDAAGKLVKRTLGTDITKYVIAIAGAAGVANDVIPVRVTPVPFRAA